MRLLLLRYFPILLTLLSGSTRPVPFLTHAQVFGQCHGTGGADPRKGGPRGTQMRATLTNANPFPATVRVRLGWPSQWRFEGIETVLDDGQRVVEISVPANGSREFDWRVRPVAD